MINHPFMHSKPLLFFSFILIFSTFSTMVLAEDTPEPSTPDSNRVRLKAGAVQYRSKSNELIATSNVSLTYQDINLQAETLTFDTETNIVEGMGDIRIIRDDVEFDSTYINFDLNNKLVYLEDIDTMIQPIDSKEVLIIRAEEIVDDGDVKVGKNGYITSCSLDMPHYFLKAETFRFIPDKRLRAKKVTIRNSNLTVLNEISENHRFLEFLEYGRLLRYVPPLTIWLPFYNYELGNRNIIYQIPTFGKRTRDGWGWFVQNTIDYDRINGEDSSVYVDWFQYQGIGLGAIHQYLIKGNQGSVYGYYFQSQEREEPNINFKLNQTFTYSDLFSAQLAYERKDAINISGYGTNDKESKLVKLKYDDLGDIYDFTLSESENFISLGKSFSTKFSRKFNSKELYGVDYSVNDNFVLDSKSTLAKLRYNAYLPHNISIDTDFNYSEKITLDLDNNYKTLLPTLVLKQTFDDLPAFADQFYYSININKKLDMRDDKTATSNLTQLQGLNKLPEIRIHYKAPKLGIFTFTEDITIARYEEIKKKDNELETIPEVNTGTFEPNIYIFKQKFTSSYSKLPFKTTLSFDGGYDQYIFKNEGYSLSEGDAQYKVYARPKLTSTFWDAIKTETNVNWNSVDEDNNSLFNATSLSSSRQYTIAQSIKFYWKSYFEWKNGTSYDVIQEKWRNYNTTLKLNPISSLSMSYTTGIQSFNAINGFLYLKEEAFSGGSERDFLGESSWTTLTSDYTVTPTKNAKIKLHITQNLNTGIYNNSYITTVFSLGKDPAYKWDFNLRFNYLTAVENESLEIENYDLQTVSLTKHAHCRKFQMSYNKIQESFEFRYTINAYPGDAFNINKNRDKWTFEAPNFDLENTSTTERL